MCSSQFNSDPGRQREQHDRTLLVWTNCSGDEKERRGAGARQAQTRRIPRGRIPAAEAPSFCRHRSLFPSSFGSRFLRVGERRNPENSRRKPDHFPEAVPRNDSAADFPTISPDERPTKALQAIRSNLTFEGSKRSGALVGPTVTNSAHTPIQAVRRQLLICMIMARRRGGPCVNGSWRWWRLR